MEGSIASEDPSCHLEHKVGDSAEGSDKVHGREHNSAMSNLVDTKPEVHLRHQKLVKRSIEGVRIVKYEIVEVVVNYSVTPPVVISFEVIEPHSVTSVTKLALLERDAGDEHLVVPHSEGVSIEEINFLVEHFKRGKLGIHPTFDLLERGALWIIS